jgi:hypothetical protein
MAEEDDLRQIRSRISIARTAQARAEVQRDEARARVGTARKVLSEEFGVSTNEEIKAKMAELQTDLDSKITAVRESLTAAGV